MLWSTNKIRSTWIEFWKKKNHFVLTSKSLIPINDQSLIWINSGIATLKEYFCGQKNPPASQLVNCQKAIRTNDIENVGHTSRHHTFFEMLGNFSIGGYFKKEAILWAFELLTEVFHLSKENLYFTVYKDDNEAYSYWKSCGIKSSHIIKCGKERNFWDVGQGPCGPCTEIYYDRGEKFDPKKNGIDLFYLDQENDRYVEIWNIVFSQYNNDGHNHYSELKRKNIDTGMGLERLACVLQDTNTNFEIDIFQNILQTINQLSPYKYDADDYFHPTSHQTEINYAFRIIADHIKACCFAIADGAIPSNKDRGYIIRRLIRRAIVYALKLEIKGNFLKEIVEAIVMSMKDYYPYLHQNKKKIILCLQNEENQFRKTLENGFKLFNELIPKKIISAKEAFKLFDTYGFPIELTTELAKQNNLSIDLLGFNKLLQKHQLISKVRQTTKAMEIQHQDLLNFTAESYFDYDKLKIEAKIIAIFDENFQQVSQIDFGKKNWLVFDKTIFYATCGGEKADQGWLLINNKNYIIEDVIKCPNGQHMHLVFFSDNFSLRINQSVVLKLNENFKKRISIHHTCTHLLHHYLMKNIDKDIKQSGSLITADKLTFDFCYHQKITDDQLLKIERDINSLIKKNLNVEFFYKSLEQIKKETYIISQFNEIYEKIKTKLRVVKIGDISWEVCAGRHVKSTKEIEEFHILKLSSKGSGSWRIEAIASNKNINDYINFLNKENNAKLEAIKKRLKINNLKDKKIEEINNIKPITLWSEIRLQQQKILNLNLLINDLINKQNKNIIYSWAKKMINKFGIDETKKFCFISLNDFDSNLLIEVMKVLINKYKDKCFLVINENKKINYLIARQTGNSSFVANKIVEKINKLVGGSGGGRENWAQGSCLLNIKNHELIKNLYQEIMKK